MIRCWLSILLLVLAGCVTAKRDIPAMGIRIGDKVVALRGAVIASCELELSSGALFGKSKSATCLEPPEKGDLYPALPRYDGHGDFIVTKILYRNGVDTVFHTIQVKEAGGDRTYWVHDYDMEKLFGVRHSP